MKKVTLMLAVLLLSFLVTACGNKPTSAPPPASAPEEASQQEISSNAQDSSSVPQVDSSSSQDDSSASQADSDDNGFRLSDSDAKAYRLLVAAIIEQYKNGTVQVSDAFPSMPEDFAFPEEMPEFAFVQNEMGYLVTSLVSENGKYQVYISIDDLYYVSDLSIEPVKPEGRPCVHAVFFDRIV